MLALTLSSVIVHGDRKFVVTGRRLVEERRNEITVQSQGRMRRYSFKVSRRRPFTLSLLKRAIDTFIEEAKS